MSLPTRHVSLVAIPEATASVIFGIHDVLSAFSLMDPLRQGERRERPFRVEIVGVAAGDVALVSGVPVRVARSVEEVDATDVVIMPSMLLPHAEEWQRGRYPSIVDWVRRMHARGATICSACSGVFLLGESGLFDGHDVTVHFVYERALQRVHPGLRTHPERALVISGRRQELVSSGASTSWHDLVLYLMSRHAGAAAAQEVARLFALQWHQDGLAPYMIFEGRTDHGDAEIRAAQEWLAGHFSVASPVEQAIQRSRLAERTFKRRFTAATGMAPLAYVQRLRIEDAKKRLERTDASVDEVSWRVGYEDAAFFRRLFRRVTGLAPGAYRKRFRVPDYGSVGSNAGAIDA